MYEVPSQDGNVFIVTGSNTGIGEVTAREIARAGGHVVMACRSGEKAEPVAADIREDTGNGDVEFMELDLASFDSVRAFADAFLARDLRLDVLVNNAGLAQNSGLTEEGFELMFGVNHLGHFLLTMLLLDRLEESAPSRVVNVASKAHYRTDGIDYGALREPSKTVSGMDRYSDSKLANVLFTVEAARRLGDTGVRFYALHPGVVASDIWRGVPWPFGSLMKLFMISNAEGAQTSLYCATSPEVSDDNGLYYDECEVEEPNRVALDPEACAKLWEKSGEWTGIGAERVV